MTRIHFEPLFQVELIHQYHPQGSYFKMQPSQETAAAMNAGGLLFKETTRGFVVLYEVQEGRPKFSPLPYGCLRFLVRLTNQPLAAHLPKDEGDLRFFLLHNRREGGRLTAEPTAGAADVVRLTPERFRLQWEAWTTSTTVTLTDAADQVLQQTRIQNVEGLFFHEVQTPHPGYFQLLREGLPPYVFFAGTPWRRAGSAGAIEIETSRLWDVVDGAHQPRSPIYQAQFPAPAYYWRYQVIPQGPHAEMELCVVDNNRTGAPDFEQPDPDQAFLFQSNQPRSLTRNTVQNLTLLSKNETSSTTLVRHLPNPGLSSPVERDANGRPYAVMFVYV